VICICLYGVAWALGFGWALIAGLGSPQGLIHLVVGFALLGLSGIGDLRDVDG
jgi:hypothetical protein